jgi:hypothetical protein
MTHVIFSKFLSSTKGRHSAVRTANAILVGSSVPFGLDIGHSTTCELLGAISTIFKKSSSGIIRILTRRQCLFSTKARHRTGTRISAGHHSRDGQSSPSRNCFMLRAPAISIAIFSSSSPSMLVPIVGPSSLPSTNSWHTIHKNYYINYSI